MAAWAGLGQGAHVTPYEYAGELGRSLPNHRVAVERIVDAYVEERYKPGATQVSEALLRAEADELDQGWRSLRPTLIGRMLMRLGAAARPRDRDNGRRNGWR
jgi:hypothetical protein